LACIRHTFQSFEPEKEEEAMEALAIEVFGSILDSLEEIKSKLDNHD
jgi:hypothetical protein